MLAAIAVLLLLVAAAKYLSDKRKRGWQGETSSVPKGSGQGANGLEGVNASKDSSQGASGLEGASAPKVLAQGVNAADSAEVALENAIAQDFIQGSKKE